MYCEFCQSVQLQFYDEQIYCEDCAAIQPQYPLAGYVCAKKSNPQRRSVYVKKGKQQYQKTQYFNIIKNLGFEQEYVEDIRLLINKIVDFNEQIVQASKLIVQSMLKKNVEEKLFNRNYFINQNSVLFFVLVYLKKFDVLERVKQLFKYGSDLKMKMLYEKHGERIDLSKISIRKTQFISGFVAQELFSESLLL
ncbi:hypothetical protein ABPG74_003067 [Tetrahymena malaccensis]